MKKATEIVKEWIDKRPGEILRIRYSDKVLVIERTGKFADRGYKTER